MAASLHQSLLMVQDLDTAVEFYSDVIGLEASVVNDSNVEFDTGQATLVLEEDFDEAVLDTFGLTEPGPDRGEGVIVALEVETTDEVDDVFERAEAANATVRMVPKDVPWGRRMTLLADPDGFTIEVSSPL